MEDNLVKRLWEDRKHNDNLLTISSGLLVLVAILNISASVKQLDSAKKFAGVKLASAAIKRNYRRRQLAQLSRSSDPDLCYCRIRGSHS